MVRRRFFPTTTAQAVPGRTVELEVQLRPRENGTSAISQDGGGEPGGDDIIGAGWFSPVFDIWTTWSWALQPDGRWSIEDEVISSQWEGDPGVAELPVPTATFRCVELRAHSDWHEGPSTHHIGVLQGVAMSDVRWEASWDAPSSSDPSVSDAIGNRFTTWGNVIVVEQINTGGDGGPGGVNWTETLTATAYSGGSAIETIILHCFHRAY